MCVYAVSSLSCPPHPVYLLKMNDSSVIDFSAKADKLP